MSSSAPGRPFRYEWDGVLRRLKLSPTVKLVAAYVSQYADTAGRHARPGVERLALETGYGSATIKRSLAKLRELGLLELVRSGSSQGRRGKANEYKLAVPADLLERVDLVDGFGSAEPSGQEQGSPGDPGSEPRDSSDTSPQPVDNPENRDHQMIRDQAAVGVSDAREQGSPGDPSSVGTGITDDRNRDHLVIHHQTRDQASILPTTPGTALLTTGPVPPREVGPVDNRKIDSDVEAEPAPPSKCPHGLSGGSREDGMPECALCRRITLPDNVIELPIVRADDQLEVSRG